MNELDALEVLGVEQEAPDRRARWRAWVQAHARQLFWAALLLAVPYLILCNGVAIFVVSALFGSGGGTCGG